MKISNQALLSVSEPLRAYIVAGSASSNNRDLLLSSNPEGRVFLSENRREWEEWYIIRDSSSSSKLYYEKDEEFPIVVFLKSTKHGHFLKTDPNGVVGTAKEGNDWEKFRMKRLPGSKESTTFVSAAHGTTLAFEPDKNRCYGRAKTNDTVNTATCTWQIEHQSGELCFIFSPALRKKIQCNIFGQLTTNRKYWSGWEVWRFTEAGDGDLIISSWTHSSKVLCSNNEGKVYTTENRRDDGVKWRVSKPQDGTGVLIQSSEHNKYLVLWYTARYDKSCRT